MQPSTYSNLSNNTSQGVFKTPNPYFGSSYSSINETKRSFLSLREYLQAKITDHQNSVKLLKGIQDNVDLTLRSLIPGPYIATPYNYSSQIPGAYYASLPTTPPIPVPPPPVITSIAPPLPAEPTSVPVVQPPPPPPLSPPLPVLVPEGNKSYIERQHKPLHPAITISTGNSATNSSRQQRSPNHLLKRELEESEECDSTGQSDISRKHPKTISALRQLEQLERKTIKRLKKRGTSKDDSETTTENIDVVTLSPE